MTRASTDFGPYPMALPFVACVRARPLPVMLRAVFLRPAVRAPALAAVCARTLATRAEIAARKAGAKEDFPLLVDQLFSRVQSAIAEGGMLEKNKGMRLGRGEPPGEGGVASSAATSSPSSPPTFYIETGTGVTFRFEADLAAKEVTMTSTKLAGSKGQLRYAFNRVSGHWECVEDKHFLVELLTRDLVYACKGYPAF